SARLAGLGAALYAANANFLFFSAQFSYESLALPLLVMVLAFVADRDEMKDRRRSVWTIPILLGTIAVIVTHHLSSYALLVTLAALSLLYFAVSRRARARGPWPFALFALAATAAWLGVVASSTVGYLTPVITNAISSTIHTLAGESAPRRLFASSETG